MIKTPATLEVSYMDTRGLYVGYRVGLARPGETVQVNYRRWYQRVWRWLTKQNWRIKSISGSTVILERCR